MAQLPSTSSILQLANTLSYTSPSNPPTITQKLLPLPSIISVTTTTTTTPTVASLSNTTNLLNTLKTGVPESDLKVLSAFLSNLASPYVKRVSTADGEETTLEVPVNALPAMHGLAVAKVKAGAQVLGNCKGNEVCLPLYSAMSDAYNLSILMDVHFGSGLTDHSRLSEVVTCLQDVFSKSLNDRTALTSSKLGEGESKKALVMRTVNLLFKAYFRLNTLRLCKNISRPVEAKGLDKVVPLGGKVEILTYNYYTGRVAMFEDDYGRAEENLVKAYKGCKGGKGGEGNMRRCLGYLIPVRMVRGCLPTQALLEKYGLTSVYSSIVTGLRTGNLRLFTTGLRTNQRSFISKGTYLLLEKCKVLCYRNLFKRVQTVLASTQLPVSAIKKAFVIAGDEETDDDEVECVVANLIFKGFVRGYISHEKKTVVLSKKEAFPKAAFRK